MIQWLVHHYVLMGVGAAALITIYETWHDRTTK